VTWNSIKNGEEFESLIRTLLLFEDPSIIPLGREGVDAGQDARSEDGQKVFQFKHHQANSTDLVVRDAKAEFEKISVYIQETDTRSKFWKDVKEWRLITNLPFNPWDEQKWQEQIVPLFQKVGIKATYWERANIEALLVKHPEVHNSYFENETRTFLSLPEHQRSFIEDEIFLQRDTLAEYVGQNSALEEIDKFIESDQKIALITGPGGIGKTRFLLEVGFRIIDRYHYQALWANNESLSTSTNWFSAVSQNKPTLLIVDEPDNEDVLKLLLEQIGNKGSRTEKWRIAICARSPKDPVIRYLESPRITKHVWPIVLRPLTSDNAENLSGMLIEAGDLSSESESFKKSAASFISKNFEGFPIWINLAVSILEKHKNLSKVPENAAGLCDYYLNEIFSEQDSYDQGDIKNTISIISLLYAFNKTDVTHLERIQQELSFNDLDKLESMLADLVKRKVLVERGAYSRFLLVKPDVIRDHLVRQWLLSSNTADRGGYKLSRKAIDILDSIVLRIKNGSVTQIDASIIQSVFRLEMIMSFNDEPYRFSEYFFSELTKCIPELSASARQTAISFIEEVAVYAPSGSLQWAAELFNSSTEPEEVKGIFKTSIVTHKEIQQDLVELIYSSLLGAESKEDMKAGVDLLSEISDIETQGKKHSRGRSDASDKLERLLEGGPHIRSDYTSIAVEKLMEMLVNLGDRNPTSGEERVLTKLFGSLTSHKTKQFWGERGKIAIRTVFPQEDAKRREERIEVVESVRKKIESGSTVATNILLWHLIDNYHSDSVHYQNRIKYELSEEYEAAEKEREKEDAKKDVETVYIDKGLPQSILDNHKEILERLTSEILDNLRWIANFDDIRKLHVKELKSIRDIWQWHLDHDDDEDRLHICRELKKQYLANSSAKEFEFLEKDRFRLDIEEGTVAKANEILDGESDSIETFVERSTEFYDENVVQVVSPVFYQLGKLGHENKKLHDFIVSGISRSKMDTKARLAIHSASSVVDVLRSNNTEKVSEFVEELVEQSVSDEVAIALICSLYASPFNSKNETISDKELRYVRSMEELFAKNDKSDLFVACVSWAAAFEYKDYQEIINRNIDWSKNNEVNERAVGNLVSGVYWWAKDIEVLPDKFNIWLLEQIFKPASLVHGHSISNYEVEAVLSKTGKVPLSWLFSTLRDRAKEERSSNKFTAIGGDVDFSDLVETIDESSGGKKEINEAIISLFDLFKDQGTVGYYLPKILHSLDRDGYLIPSKFAKYTLENHETAELPSWVELCSCYEINSKSWRVMSSALFDVSNSLDAKKRVQLYSRIIDTEPKVYSFEPGVVPPMFRKDVEKAQEYTDSETDEAFKPFWKWYSERAERRLESEVEQAREARGE